MLKYALLAGAMTLSVPAFAQEAQTAPTSPQTSQSVPTTTDQALPAQPAPATPQNAAPADSATAPAPDSAVAAQPATGPQVAQVVNQEFATYDKDGDGVLSAKEFDTWMVALKSASDPSTKATLLSGDLDETVAAIRMRLCGRDGSEIVAARQAMQGQLWC